MKKMIEEFINILMAVVGGCLLTIGLLAIVKEIIK